MALELVSFADLAKLLTLTDAAITDYPPLEVINGTMIVAFEEYLGRSLDKVARTVTVFANSFKKKKILLKGIPVASVASVVVTFGQDSETWTEFEHYEISGSGLRLYSAIQNAKAVITYTGGLAAVSEEPNLNRAALYQVAYELQTKDWIGSESVSTEGGNVTRPELGLLKETKRMLKSSRHPLHTGLP